MSFSQIMIIGHLGADPELKYTKNQNPVSTLSVGVSERTKPTDPKDKVPKTYWHKCRRWGVQAEKGNSFLKNNQRKII